MSRRLPPLNALKAFEAAARHLSFTRAAEELFVTQAAISHQIKALESHDAGGTHLEIETLKKEKLHIKDELYTILKAEADAGAK